MDDITLRNRRFGPEAAMQLVEERAPGGFARIDDVISQEDLDAIAASFSSAMTSKWSWEMPIRSRPSRHRRSWSLLLSFRCSSELKRQ